MISRRLLLSGLAATTAAACTPQQPVSTSMSYPIAPPPPDRATMGIDAVIDLSRSVAVDMESATVAANGFRYRIPCATLLCISDKPLHGSPKLPLAAKSFYDNSKVQHLQIACAALEMARHEYPDGIPNSDLRAMDEPLLGGLEI